MKKVIIIIASVAALGAAAAILFRKCKKKKGSTFRDLYEDNAPAECPLCGGEFFKPKNTLYLGKNGYGHKLTITERR